MKVVRRAFNDTFSGLVKPAVLGGVGFGIAFWVYIAWLGEDAAVAEFQTWGISALGSFGAVLLLFLVNLACAPYRLERDARRAAEAERDSLARQVQKQSVQRTLDPEKGAILTDAIRRSGARPRHMRVLYFDASQECANFASDIAEAIKNVPIECSAHNGALFTHNPKDRGIKIYRSNTKVLKSLADQIQEAFEKIGIATEQRTPTGEEKTEMIFIYVARSAQGNA